MAVFHIVASRPQQVKDFSDHPEFDVEVIKGEISAGLIFRLYETHHPCDFTVIEVREGRQRLTLVVNKSISWEDKWVGAIVDTENPKAALKYGYRI
jgi:hypothetical protein